jgi:hypothetical protein
MLDEKFFSLQVPYEYSIRFIKYTCRSFNFGRFSYCSSSGGLRKTPGRIVQIILVSLLPPFSPLIWRQVVSQKYCIHPTNYVYVVIRHKSQYVTLATLHVPNHEKASIP